MSKSHCLLRYDCHTGVFWQHRFYAVLQQLMCSLCLLVVLAGCKKQSAYVDDTNITTYQQQNGNTVKIFARLTNCTDATVTVSAHLENMRSTMRVPFTVDLSGPGEKLLTSFTVVDASRSYKYTWASHYKFGRRLIGKPKPWVYQLPYKDQQCRVLQGPYGKLSHGKGSQEEEAIDFAMPIGTKLYAARSGTVVAVRWDCTVGAHDPKLIHAFNYVYLLHDDGTYAVYAHLNTNGVLVKLGEKVNTGQLIALSGNTGYTTEPHLHFTVFSVLDGNMRRTIPITFTTPSGKLFKPKTGETY